VPPPPKPKLHCETVYKKCSYYKPERKYHWTCEYPCACHCKEPRC
jgi:hypothetical protein